MGNGAAGILSDYDQNDGSAERRLGRQADETMRGGPVDLAAMEPNDNWPMPEGPLQESPPLREPAKPSKRDTEDYFVGQVVMLLSQGRDIDLIEGKYTPSPEVVRLVKDVRMNLYPDGWNRQKIEGSEKMRSGKTVRDFVRMVVKT